MKNFSFILLICVNGFTLYAQSITLTPGQAETNHFGTDHILLKGTTAPTITGLRQGGLYSNPSNTQNSDDLISIQAHGWVNGSSTDFQGAIRFSTTQSWTNANRGNKLDIWTTKNNENTPFRRFTIEHNGKVGIGNYVLTSPDHQLEVLQPTDNDKGIGVYRYGGDAPGIFGISARGANILPASTYNGNILARFGGKGYDGTNYTTAKARIDMVANEDWSTTETGSIMKFYTTAENTIDPSEKMIIKGNGNVGIGTSDPKATMGVNGDLRLFPKRSTISGNVGTINREGKSVIFINCTSDAQIGGMNGGEDGIIVYLIISSPGLITKIIHADHTVPIGNRISTADTPGGGNFDISINDGGGVTLVYDGVEQFWRVIGVQK
ncbi:MAG: hypothetical protein ACRCVT_04510 [Leadbetterella sp.]